MSQHRHANHDKTDVRASKASAFPLCNKDSAIQQRPGQKLCFPSGLVAHLAILDAVPLLK